MLTQMIQQEVGRLAGRTGEPSRTNRDDGKWSAMDSCPGGRLRPELAGGGATAESAGPTIGDQARAVHLEILPPYLRKTKSIEELIPLAVLEGCQHGDFGDALKALVGPDVRVIGHDRHTASKLFGKKNSGDGTTILEGKQIRVRLADGCISTSVSKKIRQCILVLDGSHGRRKRMIAVVDGFRESEHPGRGCSWT